MSDAQLDAIERKLDLIAGLLARRAIDGKEYRKQVELLNEVGFTPKEIADLTGKTENNIRVTRFMIKKSKTGAKNDE